MLQEQIKKDLIEAMKAKDQLRVSTLRLLDAVLKNKVIERHAKGNDSEMSDDEIMDIIIQEVKKRNDAADLYHRGGKDDLATKEQQESLILKKYMPRPLSDEEVLQIIKDTMVSSGLAQKSDLGKLMGLLREKTHGRVEGSHLKDLVMGQLL